MKSESFRKFDVRDVFLVLFSLMIVSLIIVNAQLSNSSVLGLQSSGSSVSGSSVSNDLVGGLKTEIDGGNLLSALNASDAPNITVFYYSDGSFYYSVQAGRGLKTVELWYSEKGRPVSNVSTTRSFRQGINYTGVLIPDGNWIPSYLSYDMVTWILVLKDQQGYSVNKTVNLVAWHDITGWHYRQV